MNVLAALLNLNDAIVISVAVIVGIFMLIRSRSDIWRSNYEAAHVKTEQLTIELQAVQTELAHLRTLPTLEQLQKTLIEHNTREEEIWRQVSLVLNQIVDKLNGKPQNLA